MKKKKTRRKVFSKPELAVVRTLYRRRRPMSIKEVAEASGICWVTARKSIRKGAAFGWIKYPTTKKKKRRKATFNFKRLNELL